MEKIQLERIIFDAYIKGKKDTLKVLLEFMHSLEDSTDKEADSIFEKIIGKTNI